MEITHEFLVGLGPDVAIARTYNSLGDLTDDNGDNWRQSTDRRVYGEPLSYGAVGSTVKRVSGDGSEITYTWNGGKSAYVATDGAGAYDQLEKIGADWIWTDGDSRITERYVEYGLHPIDGSKNYRIVEQADTDGNKLTFAYDATGRLDKVTSQDGSYVQYGWHTTVPDRLLTILTGFTDLIAATVRTQTRTTYGYNGNGRLGTVTDASVRLARRRSL